MADKSWPKILVNLGGVSRYYSYRAANVLKSAIFLEAEVGDSILEENFVVRKITEEEKKEFCNLYGVQFVKTNEANA